MKKSFFYIFFFASVPLLVSGQFTHVGFAGGYGTSIKEPGFGLYGMYSMNEKIKIVPNVMYYLPHEITTLDGTQKFSWWVVNLDGNYVIMDRGAYKAYGLMGLSMVYLKGEQDEGIFQDSRYLYKMGLNVGAGIRLPVSDRISTFAEVKAVLGDKAYYTFREISTTQLGIKAGVLIRIAPEREKDTQDY